jgi:hypothetical protein
MTFYIKNQIANQIIILYTKKMESFSQILSGVQFIQKINKAYIRLKTKDFTIYFGKDWRHNAEIVVKLNRNDDEYYCRTSYIELDLTYNLDGLTSV